MDLKSQLRVVESIRNEIAYEVIERKDEMSDMPYSIKVLLIALQEAEAKLDQIKEEEGR